MNERTPPASRQSSSAAHNLESSEGQGAHPRTPSRSDAAARPEATLPGPESVAATERLDEQLAVMRRYGQDDMVLVARVLTPEQAQWAQDNGVGTKQDPDVAPWVLYLVNRSAIEAGIA